MVRGLVKMATMRLFLKTQKHVVKPAVLSTPVTVTEKPSLLQPAGRSYVHGGFYYGWVPRLAGWLLKNGINLAFLKPQ
jgi:hypothetical protein